MTNTAMGEKFDETELALLRSLAGLMIPEDAESGVPGADDDVIFTRILASVGRDMDEVRRALKVLASMTEPPPARSSCEGLAEAVSKVKKEKPALFGVIESVVARAYYCDPRVLKATGMEPQPPFPAGFLIEESNWSLLDPVRSRGPIWRKA